jgi:hypothetical protein
VHFPQTRGRTAEEADAFLTRRGLVTRRVKAYKLPNALRITVGSEEANRLVVQALAAFMTGNADAGSAAGIGGSSGGRPRPGSAQATADAAAANGGKPASMSEMQARIAALKAAARDEGGPYNEASERDFASFVGAHSALRRPNLYLLDNGNLRAVWKNAAGQHLGLQFLGGGQVQFVVFAKRADAADFVRSSGRDSLAGIDRQIASFELDRLVYP